MANRIPGPSLLDSSTLTNMVVSGGLTANGGGVIDFSGASSTFKFPTGGLGGNFGIANDLSYTFGDSTHRLITIAVRSILAGNAGASGHLIPNVSDDTFALLAATQVFTNKTLTTPTLTNPTINGATSSGSTIIDLSGNSGGFKTPTGANTFDGSSNTFSALITSLFANANTLAAGISLQTSSTATVGNQKWSPAIEQVASGWGTTGGAAQTVKAAWILEPIQSTNALVELDLVVMNGGGSYNEPLLKITQNNPIDGIIPQSTTLVFDNNGSTGYLNHNQEIRIYAGSKFFDTHYITGNTSGGDLVPYPADTNNLGKSTARWASVWSEIYCTKNQTPSFSVGMTIDPTQGSVATVTLTANMGSWTLASPAGPGQRFTLALVQGGAGGWTYGTPPTYLSTVPIYWLPDTWPPTSAATHTPPSGLIADGTIGATAFHDFVSPDGVGWMELMRYEGPGS